MFEALLSGTFTAVGYIILGSFMQYSHDEGVKAGSRVDHWASLVKAFLFCAFIALIYISFLGTHSENCDDDPLYGRCDRVVDYVPSNNERTKEFTTTLLVFFIPYTYGLWSTKSRHEE